VASLTVRNIPEDAKLRFRKIAAAHGRSMEEHLRQLILTAGFDDLNNSMGVRDMTQNFRHFEPAAPAPKTSENWVQELIRLGEGAGEGVFDREPQTLRDFDL
jgi:plasmid stability protein